MVAEGKLGRGGVGRDVSGKGSRLRTGWDTAEPGLLGATVPLKPQGDLRAGVITHEMVFTGVLPNSVPKPRHLSSMGYFISVLSPCAHQEPYHVDMAAPFHRWGPWGQASSRGSVSLRESGAVQAQDLLTPLGCLGRPDELFHRLRLDLRFLPISPAGVVPHSPGASPLVKMGVDSNVHFARHRVPPRRPLVLVPSGPMVLWPLCHLWRIWASFVSLLIVTDPGCRQQPFLSGDLQLHGKRN